MTKNNTLQFPLYHGTSTLFLDEILRSGLGGINPIEDWGVLDCIRDLRDLAEQHAGKWYIPLKYVTDVMCEQLEGRFDWRHGSVYLTAFRNKAISYAIHNEYGSEIVSRCMALYKRLGDQVIFTDNKDLNAGLDAIFKKHRRVLCHWNFAASPILITVNGLTKDMLEVSEAVTTLEKALELCEQGLGFHYLRLTRAVPPENLKMQLISSNRNVVMGDSGDIPGDLKLWDIERNE